MDDLPDHVLENRRNWTEYAPFFAETAERQWGQAEITWGSWEIPESEVNALPDVAGKDVLELGCGTAYIAGWLAQRGARAVGVDVTPAQLETARAMQSRFGLTFPLIEANAEAVPLPDASFDLVVSEYGASIWADPYAWIPETARLLRPGGSLVFLVHGTIFMLCTPDDDTPPGEMLLRPYFGMHRFAWPDAGGVEFHLGYGDWIRLLRGNGFEVENLIELQAPPGAPPSRFDEQATPEWARRWPSEEIWVARRIP